VNGPNLRTERTKRGLTQMQVAEQMGIPQTTVSANEARAIPKSDFVALYFKALDALVGPDWVSPDVLAERERIKQAVGESRRATLTKAEIIAIVEP
jgi:transcriptional regulator with XRE-family HTH domain